MAFVLKDETDFLLAQGGSVTRPHDPADASSAGSEEEVIFKSDTEGTENLKKLRALRVSVVNANVVKHMFHRF